jgi:hypothetical protein
VFPEPVTKKPRTVEEPGGALELRSGVRHASHSNSEAPVPAACGAERAEVMIFPRDFRAYLEAAAEARRCGDHGAANAAELAALIHWRLLLTAAPVKGVA